MYADGWWRKVRTTPSERERADDERVSPTQNLPVGSSGSHRGYRLFLRYIVHPYSLFSIIVKHLPVILRTECSGDVMKRAPRRCQVRTCPLSQGKQPRDGTTTDHP